LVSTLSIRKALFLIWRLLRQPRSPLALLSIQLGNMMPEDITAGTTSLVDVLPLVIQHSTISNRLGFLCSLLCTCQQTALALLDNSIGKVHLRAEAPAQLAWFGKHWRLVRSLRTNAGLWDAAMHEAIEQGLADVAAR
jgi:hypothetical protein